MSERSELVTGEAVVLELRLAKLPSRAVGFIIDAIIQVLLFVGLIAILAATSGVADQALTAALFVAGVAMIFVGLPATVETLSHGRSLGKIVMGLRVVRDDGGPIRFRHALIRALAGAFIDLWGLGWLGVGLVTSLASARGKRVGDYLAGTVVMRERIPVPYGRDSRGSPWAHDTRIAQMPPQLASWAAALDLSGLPSDLALAVRQYLARMGELAPTVRTDLGQRLAAEVAHHIGQPVPPGVPPWAFLSAVLAERRNREVARMKAPPTAAPAAQGPSSRQVEPPRSAPQAASPPSDAGARQDSPFAPPG